MLFPHHTHEFTALGNTRQLDKRVRVVMYWSFDAWPHHTTRWCSHIYNVLSCMWLNKPVWKYSNQVCWSVCVNSTISASLVWLGKPDILARYYISLAHVTQEDNTNAHTHTHPRSQCRLQQTQKHTLVETPLLDLVLHCWMLSVRCYCCICAKGRIAYLEWIWK